MQLYYWETMNPRKACAVAKYLKSPVEFVRVDGAAGEHKSPGYVARNPNGLVPLLVDGELELWESAAIMVHLATKAESDLWPLKEPARLVEVMRWISWDSCHFVRVVGQYYFEHIIKPMIPGLGEPDTAKLEAMHPQFHRLTSILDAQLAKTEFVAGPSLTIADFAVAAMLPYAERAHMPLGDHRHVVRWHDSLMKIDAWARPWPARNS